MSIAHCAKCKKYSGPMRGFGDAVKRFTKLTGIERLVKSKEKKTGKGCGCQKRREILNDLIPFNKDDE